jgi:hypothetical protein
MTSVKTQFFYSKKNEWIKNNLKIESRQHKLKVWLIRLNYKCESQFGQKIKELIGLGA